MRWREAQLGEVAKVERSGVSPDAICEGTTYVGLENIKSGGGFIDVAPVASGQLASTKFRFSAAHILYGKLRPYLAKIEAPDFAGVCSTDILPIRPGPELDRRYLLQFLRQPSQVALADSRSSGANLPRLSPTELEKFAIPLPPLPEQRRIAAILDHADTLRTKRRKSTEQLNEFSKAVFVDMFGDPVTNPLAWELKPLGQFGILDRGVSRHRPRNDPALLGGPYPLVQTGEVANSGGYIRQTEQSYSELGLKQSKLWPSGTLCITIAANIAKTGILKFDACFPDSVVGFKPITHPIDSEYVRVWLTFLQSTLEASAPESAQKNINLAILRALPIPVPPVELRRRFDARLQHLNRVADQASESASTLDALFSSLQSRAFRGEL